VGESGERGVAKFLSQKAEEGPGAARARGSESLVNPSTEHRTSFLFRGVLSLSDMHVAH
jgi:hypothetical protein